MLSSGGLSVKADRGERRDPVGLLNFGNFDFSGSKIRRVRFWQFSKMLQSAIG
jgi:hypothetical protein